MDFWEEMRKQMKSSYHDVITDNQADEKINEMSNVDLLLYLGIILDGRVLEKI